jgi:hypothetical protein
MARQPTSSDRQVSEKLSYVSPPRELELANNQTLDRGESKHRVLQLIESVVHTRKWVGVFVRKLTKVAVINALQT